MNRQSASPSSRSGLRERTDFPRLAGWMALGCFALGTALLLDNTVDAGLQLHSDPGLQAFARELTRIGEWWVAGLVGCAVSGLFLLRRRFGSARSAALATLTGLGTGLAATLLRSFIGRARPNAQVAQGFYGPWHDGHWIIGQYQFSSFPSGHAATLIGLAVAAWLINRRAGILLGVFALLVSWSRVAQASHHLSDIVASALLGLWLAPFLMKQFRAMPRHGLNPAKGLRPGDQPDAVPAAELVDQR